MMDYTKDYFDFISNGTSPFHVVMECERRLIENGYTELNMENSWNIGGNGKYYVKPYGSMLTAFKITDERGKLNRFKMIASHVDSPCLKIKPSPEIVANNYIKLNTEVYSLPIINTWFDRPLSIAGRISLKSDEILNPRIKYIDFKKPILYIPNIAIHMVRDKSKLPEIDRQKDLLPMLALVNENMGKNQYLLKLIASELGVDVKDILDFDLFVYVLEEGIVVGADHSMITSPRIDDLAMVYASLNGLIESDDSDGISMVTFFDNEDVGSASLEGADSSILPLIMERILTQYKKTKDQYYRMLPHSFMISADGSHAVHPNSPEKNDVTNIPMINKGIVIKQSAKKAYATDCETSGAIQQLCEHIGIKYQKYVNHSNILGGKTLGPILATHIPVKTVDLGAAMLGMHSARELMGKNDFEDCIRLFKAFYEL